MNTGSAAKLRVCIIIDDLGLGGAQRQLAEFVKVYPRQRLQVEVVSLSIEKTDYEAEIRRAGVPLTLIEQSGKWSWPAFKKLLAYLRKSKPDIVHTWLFTADLYGRICARLAGVSAVACAMRNTVDDMPPHYRAAGRVLAWMTNRFTVNADAIRAGMTKSLGISDRKIHTIYNGIDLSLFPKPDNLSHYRKEWDVREDTHLVAMMARMAPQKDHRTFLQAARRVLAEFENVRFILIGDGPLRSELEALAEELGIRGNVVFMGKRRDGWSILNAVDLYVHSTHFEGFCNAILEAMTASKAVVATAAGGNPEIVQHERTGLLVKENDAADLAAAILTLLRSPETARRMGQAGRARVEQEFTIERLSHNMSAFYEGLVNHERN